MKKRRYTAVIGAMKPLTKGHYFLIESAVNDILREDVDPSDPNEPLGTYVIISGNDRERKGEFPMYGDAALSAILEFYLPQEAFLDFVPENQFVKFLVPYTAKLAREFPDRPDKLRAIIAQANEVASSKNQNISWELVENKAPPAVLYDILKMPENNAKEVEIALYTGKDDLESYMKQKYLFKFGNLQLADMPRKKEGGKEISGTRTRILFSKDKDEMSDDEIEEFESLFPEIGIDPWAIHSLHRKRAGLEETLIRVINEVKKRRYDMGTNEYSVYITDVIDELQYIKHSFDSRKKVNSKYRKEASRIQDAISVLRSVKRKNDKKVNALLSEKLTRNDIRNYFKKFK
tara:strand:+ start:2876 stop:3916 length:1041 start_codon:yes stop_codon:yes gene_type:complete